MFFDVFQASTLAGLEDSIDGEIFFGRYNVIDAADDVGMGEALQNVEGPDQASVLVVLL